MILYVVRHAESIFNSEGRIQGQSDPPLSEHGRRQSEAIAEAMLHLEVQAVFASPLQRAMQTAEPIARRLNLPIQTDPRLMEIHAGIFQGKLWSEVQEQHPTEARRWKEREPDFVIPQGESRRQLAERAAGAVESIRNSGHARAVLVAHGGTLSAVMKALLEIPIQRDPISLFNASISRLEWREGEDAARLVTLNQIHHLQQAGCETRGGDL